MIELAYLLKKFPRLSETFILNELLGQESTGRCARVFARKQSDDEPRHESYDRLRAIVEPFPPFQELDPLASILPLVGGQGGLGRLETVYRLSQLLPSFRGTRLVSEALYLSRRCHELGLRHVHVHFASEAAVVAMFSNLLGGPGYSVTAHAKDIYQSELTPELLQRVIVNSRFTVTVCEANRKFLIDTLGPGVESRLRVLYNGIATENWEGSSSRDECHVLAVGRLVEKKGFHVLVSALTRLHREGKDIHATIIGDGEQRASLEAAIAERGMTKRIRLVGSLTQDQVRPWMMRASIFCAPCVIAQNGNRDALPTVLLEAMASGLPVITTPVTGIPEIVQGGRAGVLVPCGDAEALAEAIDSLLSDSTRRQKLATAGMHQVRQVFDAAQITQTLSGWFDEALMAERRGVA